MYTLWHVRFGCMSTMYCHMCTSATHCSYTLLFSNIKVTLIIQEVIYRCILLHFFGQMTERNAYFNGLASMSEVFRLCLIPYIVTNRLSVTERIYSDPSNHEAAAFCRCEVANCWLVIASIIGMLCASLIIASYLETYMFHGQCC
jgi:ABC-type xylose transport system permease subunit